LLHNKGDDYELGKDEDNLPPLPPLVCVPVSSLMRDEMLIPKSENYLYLVPKDNPGKGNCFYDSILLSNVFNPILNGKYMYKSSFDVRKDLQLFAIEMRQLPI
jgi:hypothetical protein